MLDTPIIDTLAGARVLDIDILHPDFNSIKFTEGCDGYYSRNLTLDEVVKLANELLEIANEVRIQQG